MAGDPTFLALALSSKRSVVFRALEDVHFARSAFLDIAVDGVPGVAIVSIFAWPEPAGRATRIGIDVVRIDDRILPRPISFGFDLSDDERPRPTDDTATVVSAAELEADLEETRPAVLRFGQAEWHLCASAGIQREVRALDRSGKPIFHEVDTAAYCYKLVCPKCGRSRYAMRNSIHQIKYCRVCTKQGQLRGKALVQYRERSRSAGGRKRAPPHVLDQIAQLTEEGLSGAEIGRKVDLTPSAISRIRRRLGLRE